MCATERQHGGARGLAAAFMRAKAARSRLPCSRHRTRTANVVPATLARRPKGATPRKRAVRSGGRMSRESCCHTSRPDEFSSGSACRLGGSWEYLAWSGALVDYPTEQSHWECLRRSCARCHGIAKPNDPRAKSPMRGRRLCPNRRGRPGWPAPCIYAEGTRIVEGKAVPMREASAFAVGSRPQGSAENAVVVALKRVVALPVADRLAGGDGPIPGRAPCAFDGALDSRAARVRLSRLGEESAGQGGGLRVGELRRAT